MATPSGKLSCTTPPLLPVMTKRVWWRRKLWFSVESWISSQVSDTGCWPGPSGRQTVVTDGSNCASWSGAGFCEPGTARVTGGIGVCIASGARLAVGAEVGGLASDQFTNWSVNERASIPF